MLRHFILLIVLIICATQIAEGVEVDALYLEAEKTFGTNRQYYLPEDSIPKYNLNLGMDLDLTNGLGIVYLNNVINSTTDQSQFRYVALDTELGINTTLDFQIYIRHYSGHLLDAEDPSGLRFPEENVIGVRFDLLGSDR